MANEEEPRESEEESGGPEEEGLSQDPFVEKLRPDPSEPPIQVRVLEGLLGESDREEYWRLYFSRELVAYAEFRQEDVVYSEPIPSEQPPFFGLDATRVGIRRDAAIEYTRVRAPRSVDEFDLDVRLGGAPGREGALSLGTQGTCETCQTVCFATCNTCDTQCQATCETCQTVCFATCQATCQTCFPTCFPTCRPTCRPTCGQTCDTCPGPRCGNEPFFTEVPEICRPTSVGC